MWQHNSKSQNSDVHVYVFSHWICVHSPSLPLCMNYVPAIIAYVQLWKYIWSASADMSLNVPVWSNRRPRVYKQRFKRPVIHVNLAGVASPGVTKVGLLRELSGSGHLCVLARWIKLYSQFECGRWMHTYDRTGRKYTWWNLSMFSTLTLTENDQNMNWYSIHSAVFFNILLKSFKAWQNWRKIANMQRLVTRGVSLPV